VIGLFGIGEILLTMEEGLAFKGKSAKINFDVVLADLEGAAALLAHLPPLGAGRLLDGHHARRRHAGLVHGYGMARARPRTRTRSARATSRAWWRRKPRPTPPAPRRCCRC
jgi:hypothetical protein